MKFACTVCVTVGVSVRTRSVPEVTLTTSVSCPTSSFVWSELAVPEVTVASMSVVLNPCSEMVTLYLPGANPGKDHAPDAFVICGGSFSPVASFVTTTVAPGTTPPSLSLTTPDSVALVVPPCPHTGAAISRHASARTVTFNRLAITASLSDAHSAREPDLRLLIAASVSRHDRRSTNRIMAAACRHTSTGKPDGHIGFDVATRLSVAWLTLGCPAASGGAVPNVPVVPGVPFVVAIRTGAPGPGP